jgi:hypothetical protein
VATWRAVASGGPIAFKGNKILSVEIKSWTTMQVTEVVFVRLAESFRKKYYKKQGYLTELRTVALKASQKKTEA